MLQIKHENYMNFLENGFKKLGYCEKTEDFSEKIEHLILKNNWTFSQIANNNECKIVENKSKEFIYNEVDHGNIHESYSGKKYIFENNDIRYLLHVYDDTNTVAIKAIQI